MQILRTRNVAAFLLFPKKLEDTWLNIHLVAFNLESMLSNVGILLVCGVGAKRAVESVQTKAKQVAGAIAPASFEANSDASSVYNASEVGAAQDGQGHAARSLLPQIDESAQEDDGGQVIENASNPVVFNYAVAWGAGAAKRPALRIART
jgi:hypothetical protein